MYSTNNKVSFKLLGLTLDKHKYDGIIRSSKCKYNNYSPFKKLQISLDKNGSHYKALKNLADVLEGKSNAALEKNNRILKYKLDYGLFREREDGQISAVFDFDKFKAIRGYICNTTFIIFKWDPITKTHYEKPVKIESQTRKYTDELIEQEDLKNSYIDLVFSVGAVTVNKGKIGGACQFYNRLEINAVIIYEAAPQETKSDLSFYITDEMLADINNANEQIIKV